MKSVQESKKYHGNVKCLCGYRFASHNTELKCKFKPNMVYLRRRDLVVMKHTQLNLFV